MNLELFDWIYHPSGWIALLTLTAMEVVLGIDNVVFLSLISSKLPPKQAATARMLGLVLAFAFRVLCLSLLTWLIHLTEPIATIWDHEFSWRDVILLAAGLFLIAQATTELHREVEHTEEADAKVSTSRAFGIVIVNIAVMDLVFSIDSILTAIGMAKDIMIMIIAIVIALLAMYLAATSVAAFIKAHPTAKVLALSFLVLIGFALVAEGSGFEIPRGYIYAAMGFSTAVEAINIWARNRRRAAQASTVARNASVKAPAAAKLKS
ncbi:MULTISPECIES: TerC family protein [Lichenihabitans]|uniref:TerC family protein n=1 Tax=Lichenihabitans TaxID=2723776 RepID=UPI00247AA444|nr:MULTISPECIES: TerC family protein [Lichenihabitans]